MLHETIMCLLGNVGGLFQLKTENNRQRIKVLTRPIFLQIRISVGISYFISKLVENLEFIHPAEVDICNKIAELGNCYRKICQFYDDYAFGKSYENKPLKCKLVR